MEGTPCGIPSRTSYIIDIKHMARYISIVHQDEVKYYVEEQSTRLNTYTSGIGNCIQALLKHVQSLVGNIPTISTLTGWNTTEPKLFGVGYHSWVISTADEDILLT
jgi:hypothetical protein